MSLSKKLTSAALLGAVCLALAAVVWAAPPAEQDLYGKAVEQFQKHNYKSALAAAEEYLKWYPAAENANAVRMLKGYCLTKLDQYEEAIKWWDQVLKDYPEAEKNPDMHLYLGQLHARQYNTDKAISAFRKAADLYAEAGKKKEQVAALFELVEQHKRFMDYPNTQNWQERHRLQAADVLKVYDEIVKVNLSADANVRALYDAAMYLLSSGRYEMQQPQAIAQQEIQPANPAPLGLSPITEKDFKPTVEAIKLLRRIVKEYPTHAMAPQGQFQIGQAEEGRLNDYMAALADYQVVVDQYANTQWAKEAGERIAEIKAPRIGLNVPGPTKPGEKPRLAWNIRNVKQLRFAAWKVDLFKLLRSVEQLGNLDTFQPGDTKAAAAWTFDTPDEGTHKFYNGGPDGNQLGSAIEAPLDASGAYVVRVTGVNPEGKGYTATALVLISKMAVVSKTGRDKTLLFAADSITGVPIPATNVLIQRLVRHDNRAKKNIYTYTEGEVREDGSYEQTWPASDKDNSWNRAVVVVVGAKDDYAWLGEQFYWYWYGYGEQYRLYGYTERPVYRPGQTVNFKQVIRKYDHGQYANAPDLKVSVRIIDPRGNDVYAKELITDAFGAVSGSLKLPEVDPPLGVYNIQVRVENNDYGYWQNPGSRFRVEEYKKPEYEVTISTKEDQVKIGDAMNVTINGRYYFGAPVVDAKVAYEVTRSAYTSGWHPFRPWAWYYEDVSYGRWGRGRPYSYQYRQDKVAEGTLTTDAEGNATLKIQTAAFEQTPDQDVQYQVTAKMVDASRREIAAEKSIKVTHKAFFIYPSTDRNLYGPGDRVRLKITAKNANDEPVSFEGSLEMRELTYKDVKLENGQTRREEVLGRAINLPESKVTVKDGEGEAAFKLDEEGCFKLIVHAKDAWGGDVEGGCTLWVAEKIGEFAHYNYGTVEIVPDKDTYLEGEQIKVLINTQYAGSYVLLTGEGDDLYFGQVVYIPKKSKVVEVPVTAALSPNFYLTASLMHDDQIHDDRKEVVVPPTRKFAKITIEAPKETFQPQEEADLTITATDWAGKPIEAQLSVGFVDSSVFYIQAPFREDVQKVFYGDKRRLQVRTTSSYAFRAYSAGRAGQGAGMFNDGMAQDSDAMGAPMAAPAPMMAARAMGAERMMAKGEAGPAEPAFKEAAVRKEFPDTVFWAAHVTTDAAGKAAVHVKFPDSLTTWRLTTVGFTRETQVGEAEIDIVTKKNVIVRLQAPRFFVERDLVTVSAIAHNYLDAEKTTRVHLTVAGGLGILGVGSKTAANIDPEAEPKTELYTDVQVPAGGEARVDFLCTVLSPGEATLTAKALTDTESDAMQMTYPVLEYGAEKFLAQGGVLREPQGDATLDLAFTIPEEIKRNSQSLEIQLSPSVAAVMLDALPYLLDYPYGCTEQTMSRFMPLVVTRQALMKMGITLEDLSAKVKAGGNAFADKAKRDWYHRQHAPVYDTAEMEKMTAAGLKRLASFQHGDGGWGWWKEDSSNPYMTAYVVYGLALAKGADVAVDAGMLSRGVEFLAARVASVEPAGRNWYERDDRNVRAFMLHAIATAEPGRLAKLGKQLADAYEARDELTDHGRCLLAMVLKVAGKGAEAKIVAENLENTAREDKDTDSVSWGRGSYWYWYDGDVEATAAALRAMLAVDPENPRITKTVTWLVRNRTGSRWFSTKDTAFAVLALAEYLKTTNELNPDQTVTVTVDDKLTKTFRITKENLWSFDSAFTVDAEQLAPGKHTIKVARGGRGNIYVAAYVKYFTREDPIKGAGNEVFVDRAYFRKIPKTVARTRMVWDPQQQKQVEETYQAREFDYTPINPGDVLASGDLIEVRLTIKSLNNYEYLMFEDFKPAGCEATELQSGSASGIWANMEMRDTRVAFFAAYLSQGTHHVTYELRAEIPGTFNVLPHKAGAMYSPTVRAISDSFKLGVKD